MRETDKLANPARERHERLDQILAASKAITSLSVLAEVDQEALGEHRILSTGEESALKEWVKDHEIDITLAENYLGAADDLSDEIASMIPGNYRPMPEHVVNMQDTAAEGLSHITRD